LAFVVTIFVGKTMPFTGVKFSAIETSKASVHKVLNIKAYYKTTYALQLRIICYYIDYSSLLGKPLL